MKIYVIFAQRKERYEGECVPEALEVADEFTMDENPDWLYEKLEEHKKNTELIAVDIIEVDLGSGSMDAIRDRLIGSTTVVGTIVNEQR